LQSSKKKIKKIPFFSKLGYVKLGRLITHKLNRNLFICLNIGTCIKNKKLNKQKIKKNSGKMKKIDGRKTHRDRSLQKIRYQFSDQDGTYSQFEVPFKTKTLKGLGN
jgi:hypothetical protein